MKTTKRLGLLLTVTILLIVCLGWALKRVLPLLVGSVSVTVDASVTPFVRAIDGFDDEGPRTLAAVTEASGVTVSFVENELIVMTDDNAVVAAVAERWGGKVVRQVVRGTSGLEFPGQHLIRIDPQRADPGRIAAD